MRETSCSARCCNQLTPAPEHVVDTERVARVVDEGAQGELVLLRQKKDKRSRTAKRQQVFVDGRK